MKLNINNKKGDKNLIYSLQRFTLLRYLSSILLFISLQEILISILSGGYFITSFLIIQIVPLLFLFRNMMPIFRGDNIEISGLQSNFKAFIMIKLIEQIVILIYSSMIDNYSVLLLYFVSILISIILSTLCLHNIGKIIKKEDRIYKIYKK